MTEHQIMLQKQGTEDNRFKKIQENSRKLNILWLIYLKEKFKIHTVFQS